MRERVENVEVAPVVKMNNDDILNDEIVLEQLDNQKKHGRRENAAHGKKGGGYSYLVEQAGFTVGGGFYKFCNALYTAFIPQP